MVWYFKLHRIVVLFSNWPHFRSEAENLTEMLRISVSGEEERKEGCDHLHFSNREIEAPPRPQKRGSYLRPQWKAAWANWGSGGQREWASLKQVFPSCILCPASTPSHELLPQFMRLILRTLGLPMRSFRDISDWLKVTHPFRSCQSSLQPKPSESRPSSCLH